MAIVSRERGKGVEDELCYLTTEQNIVFSDVPISTFGRLPINRTIIIGRLMFSSINRPITD